MSASVLMWSTDQENLIECNDGSHIVFTGEDEDDFAVVYTSQPVVLENLPFYFELQIVRQGESGDILIGLSMSKDVEKKSYTIGLHGGFQIFHDGEDVEVAGEVEPASDGEFLGCHVK